LPQYICYTIYGDNMKKIKSNVGRPNIKNKTDRLQIMINPKMKDEFKKVTESKGSNVSVKICELIADYLENNRKEQV